MQTQIYTLVHTYSHTHMHMNTCRYPPRHIHQTSHAHIYKQREIHSDTYTHNTHIYTTCVAIHGQISTKKYVHSQTYRTLHRDVLIYLECSIH